VNSEDITNSDRPLLSILIPTKNRQHTAVAAVIEALKVGSPPEVEVVVQDCGDDRSLELALLDAGLRDRIVYQKVEPVSMPENWDQGLRITRGDYVTIIGDDDSVLPGIVEVARWARDAQCPAVASKQQSWYGWPDFPDTSVAGKLRLRSFTGVCDRLNAKAALQRFSKTGDEYRNLPSVYHGLIKRSVLERIHAKTGKYVDALSPDIYSAYAIALHIDWYAMVDFPMTLVGASGRSNWGRNTQSTSYLNFGTAHLKEFNGYEFASVVPATTVQWGSNTESMVRAFVNASREDMIDWVDLERVFARTIIAEPRRVNEHLKKFVSAMRKLHRNLPMSLAKLFGNICGKLAASALRSLRNSDKASADEWHAGIASISEAVELQVKSILRDNVVLRHSRSEAAEIVAAEG